MAGVKAGHDPTEKFTFKFTPAHHRLLTELSGVLRLPRTVILGHALEDFARKHGHSAPRESDLKPEAGAAQ